MRLLHGVNSVAVGSQTTNEATGRLLRLGNYYFICQDTPVVE